MEDPLALPAFIISICGAVIAIVALGWNIVSWNLSGRRVHVRLGLRVHNPGRGDWASTSPRRGLPWLASRVPPTHVPYCVVFVTITVRNVGRAAVDVERFMVAVGSKRSNKRMSWTVETDPPLPARLEPGASMIREFMIDNVEALARREKKRRYRGEVALGDGTIRRSRLSYRIDGWNRGRDFLKSTEARQLSAPNE